MRMLDVAIIAEVDNERYQNTSRTPNRCAATLELADFLDA
jgi:hypothetical protein